MKRSLALLATATFVSAAPAQAADGVSLAPSAGLVPFRGHVTLAGAVKPALPGEKVHGLPRTGRVDMRTWRAIGSARAPAPRFRGTHVEVYKGRQVAFEVRKGRVVSITHVSTGATTGNTPLGTWHVYRKVTGWDWILWYPLYFLRGFALHGYPSVPAYPASHGCVRLPMWFAPTFHARWSHGATVRILP